MKNKTFFKKVNIWDPWVAQRFGACLWPRARSWRPGIESHVGLPVHGACFSLCLCLCLSLSLCVCDYHKKKIKKRKCFIKKIYFNSSIVYIQCYIVYISFRCSTYYFQLRMGLLVSLHFGEGEPLVRILIKYMNLLLKKKFICT